MHYVYGGSNNKGNIRTTALSVYEDASQCEVKIDETYGGGKNAEMDGEIDMKLDCVKNMDYIYGGARDANINNDVTVILPTVRSRRYLAVTTPAVPFTAPYRLI